MGHQLGFIRCAALVSLAIHITGCNYYYFSVYRAGISENQQGLNDLRIGMTSAEVRSAMGEGEVVRYKRLSLVDPWRTEGFSLVDGPSVLLLYYITQQPNELERPSDNELTPIVLENDRVVGWGSSFLRKNSDRYQISTPKEQR
jgi:hypothetical protein